MGKYRPEDKEYLEKKKYETKKWTDKELEEIRDNLKKELSI